MSGSRVVEEQSALGSKVCVSLQILPICIEHYLILFFRTLPTQLKFTTGNLKDFYTSIASPKEDNAIRFEPFNNMARSLQSAPYAIQLLSTIALISTRV